MPKPCKIVHSFVVKPSQLVLLRQIADIEEKSLSEVVRDALELYFATYKGESQEKLL